MSLSPEQVEKLQLDYTRLKSQIEKRNKAFLKCYHNKYMTHTPDEKLTPEQLKIKEQRIKERREYGNKRYKEVLKPANDAKKEQKKKEKAEQKKKDKAEQKRINKIIASN